MRLFSDLLYRQNIFTRFTSNFSCEIHVIALCFWLLSQANYGVYMNLKGQNYSTKLQKFSHEYVKFTWKISKSLDDILPVFLSVVCCTTSSDTRASFLKKTNKNLRKISVMYGRIRMQGSGNIGYGLMRASLRSKECPSLCMNEVYRYTERWYGHSTMNYKTIQGEATLVYL